MGLFKKVIIANEVDIYSSAVFNGANRKRSTKRNINLFLTMWLVGLWHMAQDGPSSSGADCMDSTSPSTISGIASVNQSMLRRHRVRWLKQPIVLSLLLL